MRPTRRRPVTGLLAVPGARLYHEVRGAGPPLLIVATGNGDAAPFGPMADALARSYTVITYDRRGFSRSPVDGPVEDGRRVDDDAGDARRLLAHLGHPRAHVFGSCSGGIVALALLERHPEVVRTLVVHEPPIVSVLPDAARWLRFYLDLYDTYRSRGVDVAKEIFRDHVGLHGDTRPPPSAQPPPDELAELLVRLRRNLVFWFEHEMRSFPAYQPDPLALRAAADRLVLAGSTTARDAFAYRPNAALAEQLGLPLAHLPGGHVGHVTHPVEFADGLDRILRSH